VSNSGEIRKSSANLSILARQISLIPPLILIGFDAGAALETRTRKETLPHAEDYLHFFLRRGRQRGLLGRHGLLE
jgi:hypothetical protein